MCKTGNAHFKTFTYTQKIVWAIETEIESQLPSVLYAIRFVQNGMPVTTLFQKRNHQSEFHFVQGKNKMKKRTYKTKQSTHELHSMKSKHSLELELDI